MIVTYLVIAETTDRAVEHRGNGDAVHSVAIAFKILQHFVHLAIGQALFFGAHNHGVASAGHIATQQKLLVQLLAGTQADELDIDVLANMGIVIHLITAEANHPPGQIDNPHRLAHVEHKHIATCAHGTGLKHQLGRLGNTHKVARYFRVSHCDRATVGYLLTMKPLDSHIRTANPFLAGWVAALICYPPFTLMNNGGPLDYHVATSDWAMWFADQPVLLWAWGAMLVVLTGIYAFATLAFGLRFSNLTHRGILTHGPYAWTRHPAYVSKNAYWWLATMPFIVTSGSAVDAVRNSALLAITSAVYYWRARTEEKHLLADPLYRAYYNWAEEHAPWPRLLRKMSGGRIGNRGKVDAAAMLPAE